MINNAGNSKQDINTMALTLEDLVEEEVECKRSCYEPQLVICFV